MSALLELDRVSKSFSRGGLFSKQRVEAVKDVSFALEPDKPEIFTVIGESGSGKSTLARMILGIHAPSSGQVRLAGRDVATYERRAFMAEVQPIFQNPFEAFNPLKQLDRYLFMTAERFGDASGKGAAQAQADEALRQVGLSLAEIAGRFPHELSGGQLQRVAIARALVAKPRLIVADEPVSMVDASLRMSIVNLFGRLRDQLGLSIVYITHDLATAYYISDRLIIMQKGVVVEQGPARAVLSAPTHPYSRQLRDAVLTPDSAGAFRADHSPKAVATSGDMP
ncbi:ABC transporter ATP-binding protein [Bosea caraganae]|uniref:ABC transporter ATP-binding protein n=1 Tax=Bosea caraganae TaxID=2763117 RepID=A0A370KXQ7_9HYPH|nr:ATP-binding cassette domain-containing protein [Bosea caraganae]RDJ19785.1 ABC transporter ATP-binding protein [Bosea caraganae]RDJ21111.1 ABC transporter ATP-binding protein [Bosea caraganae]